MKCAAVSSIAVWYEFCKDVRLTMWDSRCNSKRVANPDVNEHPVHVKEHRCDALGRYGHLRTHLRLVRWHARGFALVRSRSELNTARSGRRSQDSGFGFAVFRANPWRWQIRRKRRSHVECTRDKRVFEHGRCTGDQRAPFHAARRIGLSMCAMTARRFPGRRFFRRKPLILRFGRHRMAIF